MVSCGSCNRWQHIACHDLIDQRAGRPRRDWERQQFFCGRCRQRVLNGGSHSGHGGHSHPAHQQQYAWQGGRGSIHLQKPGGDPYAQSDPRYGHRSPVENGIGYPQQQYMSNNAPLVPYARSYPNVGVSFNQYQPDQRGLSRAAPAVSQGSWSSSSNGYVATPELSGRMQSSHFVPQYPHNGGVYASNRISSVYTVYCYELT